MAFKTFDRVKETTNTSGTGTMTLAGAVAGFQAFSAIGNANTCEYLIVDGNNWEVGYGTYTSSGTTLSRDTVYASSSGGSKITLSGSAAVVSLVAPAQRFKGFQLGSIQSFLTHASGTYTTPTGCKLIHVRMVGAGGSSGANPAASAGQCCIAGSAGSGAALEAWIFGPSATYSYVVGTAGSAPSAGANDGNDGTASTFGTALLSAGPGLKGGQGSSSSFVGGSGGTTGAGGTASGGDINIPGVQGQAGWRISATLGGIGTMGGTPPLGWAPTNYFPVSNTTATQYAGHAGAGNGQGGTGGICTASASSLVGYAGSDGAIIVEEYY